MQAHRVQLVEHADVRFGSAISVVSVISSSKLVGDTSWRRNTERQRPMKLAWRSCFSDRLIDTRPGFWMRSLKRR